MEASIQWLLDGDVSARYLTYRLLLDGDAETLEILQARIAKEGYGARFLSARGEDGHWGCWFYQPKWTCTHYTLADMKEIGMPRDTTACREMVVRIFNECMLDCGGVNFARTMVQSDLAVDGMILNYASYFCPDEKRLEKLAGYILSQAKPDGGYSWDGKSNNSDPHTTVCVLEGFLSYRVAGFTKLLGDIKSSEVRAIGWLLSNGLIAHEDKNYQKLSYPYRYRYDLLRVLEYLALNKVPYDRQMEPALQWLEKKRRSSGVWNLENVYRGNVHFELEEKGKPSRFITVKALLIQKTYHKSTF